MFRFVIALVLIEGIHPHDAKSYTEESWEDLKAVAGNPECVAVGECGLDYNRNFSEPEEQRMVFRKQVVMSQLLLKGLFMHSLGRLSWRVN